MGGQLNIKKPTSKQTTHTHIFSLALLQLHMTNPTGDNAYLDRMALISQVLLQPRLLQLRNENEELKLKLFWKEHCKSKLQELMTESNQNGPQCTCLSCAVSGRMDERQQAMPWGTDCKFKPWFEELLAKHELTAETGVQIYQEPVGQHMSMDDLNLLYDIDTHFHHLTRDDWFAWTYGAKLWKAKYVHDKELQKLSALFQSLSAVAENSSE